MLDRCYRKTDGGYKKYGGRGISVCDRWQGTEGFFNFLKDMGERPTGTSLDRINNDGNYEPDNCRWATALEQAHNRGTYNTNKVNCNGVSKYKNGKWRARIKSSNKEIHLGLFDDLEDAIQARKQAEVLYWSADVA